MNSTEITLSVFADYSKAFDTVDYHTLLLKLHSLNFSNPSLKLILNYLCNRKQFVQIDDQKSNFNTVTFGVPQGSILGPILFNIYVSSMLDTTKSAKCLQFADDTTLYVHGKINTIKQNAKSLESDIDNLKQWSNESNLIFNNDKTKMMLFSTKQLSNRHNLKDKSIAQITIDNILMERKESMKVLGIILHENLDWNDHISCILTNGYSTLRTLRKIKRLTPYHVRKSLAECLILSKINYGIELLKTSPMYLIKRLQRLQNATAGYVLGRYAKQADVIGLKWLTVQEQMDFCISKLAFKSINDETFPKYLNLSYNVKHDKNNEEYVTISRCKYKNTFQDETGKVYNELPIAIRKLNDYSCFIKETKCFYLSKGLAKAI